MNDPQDVRQADLPEQFLTGPGEAIVKELIKSMASLSQFQRFFGTWTGPGDEDSRWSDYPRSDWPTRELPAINIFEKDSEEKTSSNAWLNGSIGIQIFWPPSQRRSDRTRIARSMSAAITNFFESTAAFNVLANVPGLNELGRFLTWSPNVEGVVENDLVPVTMVDVKYRVDLREWYRFLTSDDRTKELPYERTLANLNEIKGEYDGVDEEQDIHISIEEDIVYT